MSSSELESLRAEVASLHRQLKKQSYGLVWLDVPEAFESSVEESIPTLKSLEELDIDNVGGQQSHILIEGDNYHALHCLNYTHAKKVDVIYIDPPYNTGSDGFRYKDARFLKKHPDGETIQKDHPLRHSTWLSFMNKRLKLAKNLLRPEGVIFISINEEELAQLKLLCDQIFLPSNYLTMFTIKVRHEERILTGDKDFQEVVEYLLMYRSSPAYKAIKQKRDNTSLEDYVWQVEPGAAPSGTMKLGTREVEYFAPGNYHITKVEPSTVALKHYSIRGTLKKGNSSGRFYEEHLRPLHGDMKRFLFKVPNIGEDGLGYRFFMTPDENRNGEYYQGLPLNRQDVRYVPHPNYKDWEAEFNTVGQEGSVDFGGGKKPIDFLSHYLSIGSEKKDAIILDFFGGSGSTGHAVLKMNEEDGGCRQFILVSLADETVNETVTPIMRDICLRRFNQLRGEFNFGLKFFETSFAGRSSPSAANDEELVILAREANDLVALAENTLSRLSEADSYSIYKGEVEARFTAIYFDEDLSNFDDFLDEIRSLRGNVTVYQFSWGAFPPALAELEAEGFRARPIPKPILDIYKTLNGG